MGINIHYITPYAIDGNIGQAYNKACSDIQDPDAWIVIRDGDTMFLTPEWGRVIQETIEKHGDRYALFGAMTNRLNEYHQKVDGMFGEMDLRKHYEKAKELETRSRTDVFETVFDIAGMFMAFQKKTWTAVRGFDENTNVFDRIFTRRVLQRNGKVAVMKGLYVLHAYRLWSDDPVNSVDHLI